MLEICSIEIEQRRKNDAQTARLPLASCPVTSGCSGRESRASVGGLLLEGLPVVERRGRRRPLGRRTGILTDAARMRADARASWRTRTAIGDVRGSSMSSIIFGHARGRLAPINASQQRRPTLSLSFSRRSVAGKGHPLAPDGVSPAESTAPAARSSPETPCCNGARRAVLPRTSLGAQPDGPRDVRDLQRSEVGRVRGTDPVLAVQLFLRCVKLC